MTTSIDKLRAEVEAVRAAHGWTPTGTRGTDGYCSKCGPESWPCPTLKFAEKVLKLAEALDAMRLASHNAPMRFDAERVLADVAGE